MERNENEIIRDLSIASVDPKLESEGGVPFVTVPPGYQVTGLEQFGLRPRRKRGLVTLTEQYSFSEFVNHHKTNETMIYSMADPAQFVAVIDDHGSNPGWREFRALWKCPLSIEWRAWMGASGQQMSQTAFALFIENNLADIHEPTAATMLEVSRRLEATKSVKFASDTRLDNGQVQFVYEEEIRGSVGKGKMDVPSVFVIGVPVFEGGTTYRIEAKFRYRLKDAELMLWYDLDRPHKILEDAIKIARQEIESATGLTVLAGQP